MALDDVTRDELQGIIAQLKESLYNHQQWHSALIRALICKLPGDKHDIGINAHTECRFGQWYYSKAPEKISTHPGYIALGDEHQRLHHMARLLLIAANANSVISTLDYDNFANALERMRLEIFALERELENTLFNHDSLTGAITRFGILPTLREQQELVKRHAQLCYIAMMDLDNFKAINDLHGHAAGDIVLTQSVRYLIKHLRPYDKVFRYGGEEFLLCLPYTELMSGHDRVMKLNEGLASLEIDVGEKEPIHITASFGLTLLDPELPVETSIDRADKALYAAKAAGRNCLKIWDSSM
ncbi:diguanylate cyclase [Rhodanobacter sp. OK091]|uniref:diguanylate cyclase n=1 Tax=Rhodanobacter sp. OK091 TaxID=1881037 RepID=UPI00091C5901|nr:diguanylate cyclase [Rhodanobacter sp. OK091]SHM15626.1 diguanylate cyclase (GGDEF) domain-containing protein [Rhodanobacter sp. OK091]